MVEVSDGHNRRVMLHAVLIYGNAHPAGGLTFASRFKDSSVSSTEF
jgi:hypothetical protein